VSGKVRERLCAVLERMGNKVFVTCFKILSKHLHGKTENTTKASG
jgi:hypothetical protein